MTPRPGTTNGPWIITRQGDSLVPIGRLVPPKHGKRIEPHGEIVEILTVPIGLFANTDATLPSQHTLNLTLQCYSLVKELLLLQLLIKRDEEDEAKGISPQITQPVRPDVLRPHEGKLGEDIVDALESGHGPDAIWAWADRSSAFYLRLRAPR